MKKEILGFSEELKKYILVFSTPSNAEKSNFKDYMKEKYDIYDDGNNFHISILVDKEEDLKKVENDYNNYYNGKSLYVGVFNFNKEKHILYTYAFSRKQSFIFFCQKLNAIYKNMFSSTLFFNQYFKCKENSYFIKSLKGYGYKDKIKDIEEMI